MKHRLRKAPENDPFLTACAPRLLSTFELVSQAILPGDQLKGREMMRKFILAIALGSFAAGAAYAQPTFEDVDVNTDGAVSFAEAANAGMPWTEDQFKTADRNADGVLDADEFAAAIQ